MATEERDHTADWIVPAERRPPSALDLAAPDRRRDGRRPGGRRGGDGDRPGLARGGRAGARSRRSTPSARPRPASPWRGPRPPVRSRRRPSSRRRSRARSRSRTRPRPTGRLPGTGRGPRPRGDPRLRAARRLVAGRASARRDGTDRAAGAGPEPIAETFAPAPNGSDPGPAPARPARPTAQPDPFDERMIAFRDRAERVLVRLAAARCRPAGILSRTTRLDQARSHGRRHLRVPRNDRRAGSDRRNGPPVRRRADHPQRRALRPRGHVPGADRRADEGARPVRRDDPGRVRRHGPRPGHLRDDRRGALARLDLDLRRRQHPLHRLLPADEVRHRRAEGLLPAEDGDRRDPRRLLALGARGRLRRAGHQGLAPRRTPTATGSSTARRCGSPTGSARASSSC